MVDIWGALSSYQSQFHLQASWWSSHTPARRPWNCNWFNKRRTPAGKRVNTIRKNTRRRVVVQCTLNQQEDQGRRKVSPWHALLTPDLQHPLGEHAKLGQLAAAWFQPPSWQHLWRKQNLKTELKNEDKYTHYLQDLSSFINAVQGVSVGS